MQASSDSSTSSLFELADQILADMSAGRLQPLAHYLARFPGREEQVAREFLTLTSRKTTVDEAPVDPAAPGAGADRQSRIGPFRIVSLLGRGGQGVVYRAEDVRLARTVALKVLSLTLASVSHGRRSRFRREAAIVSRLDHPGICTILDADLDGDTPYIAMRYVEGETLGVALARAREVRAQGDPTPSTQTSTSASRLLAPRRALELSEALTFFERAARALHAAHEAGVVHRDVKPGNIMVSTDGSPVILDFGLARGADEDSAQLTRSDEVFGTPAYISPEQLDSGHRVDRRTDVYSLGVVLYECLTLERPFTGENGTQLAEAIRRAPVKAPALFNPAVPHDLEVVLETALERDVERRYPTALELAEELRRVREYEPIRARPAGPLLRLTRWAQRNPVLATGTIGSIAALSIALAVALVLLGRVQEEQGRKEVALNRYEGAFYRDFAASTTTMWPVRALHYAIAAAERDPGLASNRVLLQSLDALYQKQALVWTGGSASQVDIAPDGGRLLSAAADGITRLWDPHTGVELASFGGHTAGVHCARFDARCERFVSASMDGTARIVRVSATGAEPIVLAGHAGDVNWAEFSPDGTRVVTAGRDHTVRVWDATSGAELLRLEGHRGNVSEARYISDGRRILTRSGEPPFDHPAPESDGSVRIFDADTGRVQHAFLHHSEQVRSVALSKDERWLATASADRTARLYRLDAGTALEPEPVRSIEAPGKFHSVDFSPDGRMLALAYDAGGRVVEPETGRTVYELPSHDRRAVAWCAFSPDGASLATVAYDSALRLFRASDGELLRVCRGDTRSVQAGAWSPDGQWIATWQRLAQIDIWYAGERPFLQVLRGHGDQVVSVRFDRSAARLVTASRDGTARLWSAEDGTLLDVLDSGAAPGPALIGAVFDPGGVLVATTDEQGTTRIHSMDRGERGSELARIDSLTPASIATCFDPAGGLLWVPDGPRGFRIVDVRPVFDGGSLHSTHVDAHESEITCVRFAPEGRLLVTGGRDRRLAVWELEPAEDAPRVVLRWRSEPFASQRYDLDSIFDVTFHPAGRMIAAAYQSMDVVLVDLVTGRQRATARATTTGRVCFSPDGRLLFGTSKWVNTTTIWQIRTQPAGGDLELERVPVDETVGLQHANSITSLACAPEAELVLTGSLDKTARLWNIRTTKCIASFQGHTDAVWDVDISSDGNRIATASADGTARLWPGDPLELARRLEPAALAGRFGVLPPAGVSTSAPDGR